MNCSFDCNSFWAHIQCFAVPLNSQRGSFAGGYAGHDGSIPASEHFTVGHSSLEGGLRSPNIAINITGSANSLRPLLLCRAIHASCRAVANPMNTNSKLQRAFFVQCAMHRLRFKSILGKCPTRGYPGPKIKGIILDCLSNAGGC